jgi:hypothetical protein
MRMFSWTGVGIDTTFWRDAYVFVAGIGRTEVVGLKSEIPCGLGLGFGRLRRVLGPMMGRCGLLFVGNGEAVTVCILSNFNDGCK